MIKGSFLLVLLSYSISCNADDISIKQQSIAQQALANATSKIDLNKIQQQQAQQNKDNVLSARIYEITTIPTWRNLIFIRQSRVGNSVNPELLIKQINDYLIQYNHPQLTSHQQSLLTHAIN
ncbi:MAG TPA: hypothetical protein PLP75_01360 [Burkholderiales bacterium]|nr:hypothetical protein [Burkholderiales bacterium]